MVIHVDDNGLMVVKNISLMWVMIILFSKESQSVSHSERRVLTACCCPFRVELSIVLHQRPLKFYMNVFCLYSSLLTSEKNKPCTSKDWRGPFLLSFLVSMQLNLTDNCLLNIANHLLSQHLHNSEKYQMRSCFSPFLFSLSLFLFQFVHTVFL